MPMFDLDVRPGRYPWMREPHWATFGLADAVADLMPAQYRELLPEDITLVFTDDIDRRHLDFLMSAMVVQLRREISVWTDRLSAIRNNWPRLSGLPDLNATLCTLRRCQPWIVLVTASGGFAATTDHGEGAVVTCSTKQHHGVAWWMSAAGTRRSALVTARAEGEDWNWDSDIGHEATHAAFAPVPLFTQTIERESRRARLTENAVRTPEDLTSTQLCRIFYVASELITVVMRGEQRFTGTGLPEFEEAGEFHRFLSLMEDFVPGLTVRGDIELLRTRQSYCVATDSELVRMLPALLRFSATMSAAYAATSPPPVANLRRALYGSDSTGLRGAGAS